MCDTCGCSQHQAHLVTLEQDVLEKNSEIAAYNRKYFSDHYMKAFNLMSSPGSGKTSLLIKTIEQLKPVCEIAVIEGDQQTDLDAQKIASQNVQVFQINTGKACHLEASAVSHALSHLHAHNHSILFIENVGNLVCPASFDLGESFKVVILSVTEGEDKPLKYPYMFHAADVILINKIDLLPYVEFDVDQCVRYMRQINPEVRVFRLSAKTCEGFSDWIRWILKDNMN
jgi:hydrogenase nickel incorporation protein HypB